jgi:hypothetical protein
MKRSYGLLCSVVVASALVVGCGDDARTVTRDFRFRIDTGRPPRDGGVKKDSSPEDGAVGKDGIVNRDAKPSEDGIAGRDAGVMDAAADASGRDASIVKDGPIWLVDSRPVADYRWRPDVGPRPDAVAPDVYFGDFRPFYDVGPRPDFGPRLDFGPVADFRVGDAAVPRCNYSVVGKHCRSDADCGVGASCLGTYRDDPNDPATQGGICTCTCTPDDPDTRLINEDDCGTATDDVVCGELELSGGQVVNYCMKTCQPRLGVNSCDGRIACDPRAGFRAGIYDATICLDAGCRNDSDCRVTTAARCTVGGAAQPCTQPGAQCLSISPGSSAGICVIPGVCDVASGLCRERSSKPTTFNANAQVGDACGGDVDCAANQTCLFEFTAPGAIRPSFRNGYCAIAACSFAATLPTQACPSGSACNHLFSGGLCQKTCTLANAASCRNNPNDALGDYECRDYSNLVSPSTGRPVAAAPTCDWGSNMDCNTAAAIAGGQLGSNPCALFGDGPSNSTNMRCRDITTGATVNPSGTPPRYPAEGHCLDDTSS